MNEKTVRFYRSRIVVNDYELGESGIEEKLALFDPITFSYTDFLFQYDEEKMELILPGGLDDNLIREYFPDRDYIFEDNYYDAPQEITYKCINEPRNTYQQESLEFLASDSEGQKMLCLPTGMGKTYCVINHVANARVKSMIFVDQTSHLMNQWMQEFLIHTDIDQSLIYPIVGMESIDVLLQIDEVLPFEVYLVSHSTIRNLIKSEGGPEKFDYLMNKLGIGIKVFDEAHVEWININNLDTMSDTYETIYLTATPNRSDYREDAVYQRIFHQVPKFGLQYREIAEEKYQNLTLVKYNSNPTQEDINRMSTRRGFDGNQHSDYLYQDEKFEEVLELVNGILDEMDQNKVSKVAIICQKNDFIQKLYDNLMVSRKGKSIGRFSSLVDPDEKTKELENDIIISTNRSLDKAVDIKGLDGVICLSQYSSQVLGRQLVGRIRNPFDDEKEVYYYDVTDVGFPRCRGQLKRRTPALVSKAKSVREIDF